MILVFLLGILTVYRLTLALHKEAGPFHLLEKWHNWLEGNPYKFNPGPDGLFLRTLYELFECFYCLSFWIAFLIALVLALYLDNWLMILTWPALSGGAIALWEVINNE